MLRKRRDEEAKMEVEWGGGGRKERVSGEDKR